MRIELLLALRGLAALWVLMCHSMSGDYRHLAWGSAWFRHVASIMQVGFFGVSLFFFISGYGIAGSMERHRSRALAFLKRRAWRIYPPYWISLFLILAEVFLITRSRLQSHAELPALRQILQSLSLIQIPNLQHLNPVYWSLGYEMHFYLLATLSLVLFSRRGPLFLLFDLFSFLVLFAYVRSFSFGAADALFTLHYYWFDFFWGILLYRILRNPRRWGPWLYTAFWGFLFARYLANAPGRYFVAPAAMIVCLALHPWDAHLAQAAWMKPFFWLGRISFSLFLTNVMVGPKLLGAVNRLTIMTTGVYVLTLLVGTAGSLAVAYLFYRYIEAPLAKIPESEPWRTTNPIA